MCPDGVGKAGAVRRRGRAVVSGFGLVGLVGLAAVAMAEFLHWRASRQLVTRRDGRRWLPWSRSGGGRPATGAQAVVVLGFPSARSGRLHPLQRWRTEIGARSLRPGDDSRLIFTGGGDGAVSEAVAMAGYARDVLGVPAERIRLETAARSTRENIAFTLPLVEAADTVSIASDPLHAARGRHYLHQLRPDLAPRLVPADDYRFGDHWWLKVPTAAYELIRASIRAAEIVMGRQVVPGGRERQGLRSRRRSPDALASGE